MPKFTVNFMTPAVTWEGVEAADESEAIEKCISPESSGNEPYYWHVVQEEEEPVEVVGDVCEYYPPPDWDHGGWCGAGVGFAGKACTLEYSQTCEAAQEAKAREFLLSIREEA